jgi:hypothetical protein
MNRVEYKKRNSYEVIYYLHLLRRAVRSCLRDRKLTITSQQTFISGSNFDPDVLFLPLAWWYSELNCNWRPAMASCVFVQLWSAAGHGDRSVFHARETKLRDKNTEANIKWLFTADTQKYFCVPYIHPEGRRRRKLLDDFKERRGYSQLKEEARFGRGFGPVVRQTTKWIFNPTHQHIDLNIITFCCIATISDTRLWLTYEGGYKNRLL